MPVEVPKNGVLRPPVAPVRQRQQKAAPALTEAAWNCGLRAHGLLGDLIGTLPGGIFGGLNRQPGLAAQETDEAAHGVLLPVGRFHGVDKQMHSGRRVSRYLSA